MPFPISVAGQSNSPQTKRPTRSSLHGSSTPLFGAVTVSGDQVHFGAKHAEASTTREPQTAAVQQTQPAGDTAAQTPKPPEAQANPAPKYGHFQNNMRAGAGFFFRDMLPVLFSFAPMFLTRFLGPVGWAAGFALALVGLPVSFLSGKFGRRIAKDVDPNNLNWLFKYLSSARQIIKNPAPTDPNTPVVPVVDRLNGALNDALNVRNAGWFTKWLGPKLMLSKDGWLGKILERFSAHYGTVLKAEVNSQVAQAENAGQATKAVAKGVWNYSFYSVLNWAGTGIAKVGIWPFTWIGEMMKQAGWLKIAADVVSGKAAPAPVMTTSTPAVAQ